MKKILVVALVMSVLVVSGSVQAKSLEEKVDALSSRMSALEKSNLDRGSNIASAVSRAESIQTEFAAVKGAVDSNSHLISATNNQLQSLFGDLERRLQSLEEQIQLMNKLLKKKLGTASFKKSANEYLVYEAAIDKMNYGDYLTAAAMFQEFISNYPRSKIVPEAQFRVAECYFEAKDYKQSIRQFQVFIERNPRNKNVPNALVMQGSAFVALDMKNEAKVFYTKVIHDYPKSKAAPRAKAKIDMLEGRGAVTARNRYAQPRGVVTEYPQETIQQQRDRLSPPTKQKPKSDLEY
jgi:tol-pal system protein YbgF